MKSIIIVAAVTTALFAGCRSTPNLSPSSALPGRAVENAVTSSNKLVYLRSVRTSPVQMYQGAGAASLSGLDPNIIGAVAGLAKEGVAQVGQGYRESLEQGNKTVRNTVNEFSEAIIIGQMDQDAITAIVQGYSAGAKPIAAQAELPAPTPAVTPLVTGTPIKLSDMLNGLPPGSTISTNGVVVLPPPVDPPVLVPDGGALPPGDDELPPPPPSDSGE